ncbi:hypothetical protein [Melissococcus plutonius]|uniref:hypothetical protein n=1 Tax=Melissococcus plutonius TaxID=33970 RepID=UPI00065E4277|nr:hypothetical protein [Melissococcus plutonius]
MKKIWLWLKRIRELIIGQLHTIFFLSGLYCMIQAAYFFSPILALIISGIACFLISFLINRSSGGGF